MAKRFLTLVALLMLGFYVAGCAEGDESASVVNPNPSVFTPTGSISGVVVDACTGALIEGATVSVAYNGKVYKVKTSAQGQFTFNNVPANYKGPYFVSCDLGTVTGDPYDGASFIEYAYVGYSDLNDGDNDSDVEESGSGADTPVDKLNSSIVFEVSNPTNSVAGVVYDKTYGTNPLADATVALFDDDSNLISYATTAANGTFTISNVPAGDGYYLQVIKSGYVYWNVTAASDCEGPDSSKLWLPCEVGCSSIPVNAGAIFVMQSVVRDNIIPFISNIDVQIGTFAASGAFSGDEFMYDDEGDVLSPLVTSFGITFSEPMLTGHSSIYDAVQLEASLAIVVSTAGVEHVLTDTMLYSVDYDLAWDSTHQVLTLTPDITIADDDVLIRAGFGEDRPTATVTYAAGYYRITFGERNTFGEGAPSLSLADAHGCPWWYGDFSSNYMSVLSGIQSMILDDDYFEILVGDKDYYRDLRSRNE